MTTRNLLIASFSVTITAVMLSVGLAAYPNYPPEPTVTEYAPDPSWPKRPEALGPKAAVPSIAVDRQDRVWCLERGQVPVQVYSSGGELVASWGRGEFKGPHSLRFDGQENVWITDFPSGRSRGPNNISFSFEISVSGVPPELEMLRMPFPDWLYTILSSTLQLTSKTWASGSVSHKGIGDPPLTEAFFTLLSVIDQ